MNSINFVLLGLVFVILYFLTTKYGTNDICTNIDIKNKKDNKKKEKFDQTYYYTTKDNSVVDEIINDIVSWEDSEYYDSGVVKKEILNPNFINNKFNNDYRDVLTALNNLVPDRKQLFNLANIPVVYSEPEVDEVRNMISDFVVVLNNNLKTEVPSYRNPNSGWDEAIPDPNMKSGWDKVQESLGLPPSLYSSPAPKQPIKLIDVTEVQKYETEDEVKYSIDMVLQKKNVEDQMILKISFVQDKRPLRDENNFFVTHTVELRVVIEEAFILGYLSKEGNDAQLLYDNQAEKFYDYNQLEYNNLTDPKYIQKILLEKYNQRSQEMEQRNALLDAEGRDFHRTLPHLYDYSNIEGTQTIFDDMNMHKTFY